MSQSLSFWKSTLGMKQVVAITGLGLVLFVISHVSGNFLIFVGPRAYNMYSHALVSNPLIYAAEAGLLALFLGHLILAMVVSIKNRLARNNHYAVLPHGEKRTSLTTKTMAAQGIIILVFVIFHLITFKFGPYYTTVYDGVKVRDLFQLVIEVFQSPAYVGFYLFCLVTLGLHLSHGVSSTIQTLGFHHPSYEPLVKKIGVMVALYVSIGFITQPLYVFFFHNG